MKQVIATVEAPAAVGPYSQAIRAGDFLFCSGQIPLEPESGNLVEGDISAQTTRALENLGAVLRAAKLSFSDVIKTTVFLTDLREFKEMNMAYLEYFDEIRPARSTIQVAALPKGARVEIEAVAFAGTD